jgi:hypothetical protein
MPVQDNPTVAVSTNNTNQAGSAIIGKVGIDATTPGTTNNVALGIGVPAAAGVTKAEDAASASGDVGIAVFAVRAATPANTSGTDGDYEPLQVNGGLLWTQAKSTNQSTGIVPTYSTSANASGAAVDLSAAPTSTQKIVVDNLFISTLTAMIITFSCETTGALFRVNLAANSAPIFLRGLGIKLPTADKKFQYQTSASGQVDIFCQSHSEA